MHGPSLVERARTALHASPILELVADGMHELVTQHRTDRHGRVSLLLAPSSPVVAAIRRAPVAMLLSGASLRPVELADRVRARVELGGFLCGTRPLPVNWVVVQAQVLTVGLDGVPVDPRTFAAARPDPFVDAEPALVRTLLRHRPAALAAACAQVAPRLVAAASALAPSGLDRYGVSVWLAGHRWTRELRLDFPAPLDRDDDVRAAVEQLLDTRFDADTAAGRSTAGPPSWPQPRG